MNKHGNCGLLLNGVGVLATAGAGKAEVLCAFFASVFTNHLPSLCVFKLPVVEEA